MQLPSGAGRIGIEDYARIAFELRHNREAWTAILGLESAPESIASEWMERITDDITNPESSLDKMMLAVAASVLRQFINIIEDLADMHEQKGEEDVHEEEQESA